MITIIDSSIQSDSPQIDGRRHVIERHISSEGRSFLIFYMARQNDDINSIMANRVPKLELSENLRYSGEAERIRKEQLYARTLLQLTDEQVINILQIDSGDINYERTRLQEITGDESGRSR